MGILPCKIAARLESGEIISFNADFPKLFTLCFEEKDFLEMCDKHFMIMIKEKFNLADHEPDTLAPECGGMGFFDYKNKKAFACVDEFHLLSFPMYIIDQVNYFYKPENLNILKKTFQKIKQEGSFFNINTGKKHEMKVDDVFEALSSLKVLEEDVDSILEKGRSACMEELPLLTIPKGREGESKILNPYFSVFDVEYPMWDVFELDVEYSNLLILKDYLNKEGLLGNEDQEGWSSFFEQMGYLTAY
ncbi:hypothetical protein [Serratia sp. Se-RSBMAAmG]|uniref:hypothetical protein n=1 Tax=Serratia sp. Se-RSBMAAmG TaxID=3043305 RepID=UPI0024AF7667|nr:hypothetical protein [Serratia sp. Se-RSBMAAmG]MDI6976134.1 hypothetical protein [Serratia sp. Se-RSBMAAmG]